MTAKMDNAFPFYFTLELQAAKKFITLPYLLKEVVRKNDIENYEKLFEFFEQELENSSIQTDEQINYFFFIVQATFKSFFFEQKNARFTEVVELIKHRMGAIKQLSQDQEKVNSWEQYLELCTQAFDRNMRYISIEKFESYIDQLDWALFQPEIISDVSSVIGLTYLNEDQRAQLQKSRIWLTKSAQESQEIHRQLVSQLHLAEYYFSQTPENWSMYIDKVVEMIEGLDIPEEEVQQIANSVKHILEFKKHLCLWKEGNKEKKEIDLLIRELNSLESKYRSAECQKSLTDFARIEIEPVLAQYYHFLFDLTEDSLEKESFSKNSLQYIDSASEIVNKLSHTDAEMRLKLQKIIYSSDFYQATTEKDSKEIIQFYKKGRNYEGYIHANRAFAGVLNNNQNGEKCYDLLEDILKYGIKRIEEGGFHLITRGFALANEIFMHESKNPGVSWMIHDLDNFFDFIVQIIDQMESYFKIIGKQAFALFQEEYIRFRPVSEFNIKVFYRYQLYSLKMMERAASIAQQDGIKSLARQLLSQFEDSNNPLSFIQANWDEFKNVPNSVRNKTINKCISISKGDLPLAAEHLDFSYRNLRSYITFNEVNRLGFFLDMVQTDNKQLEQGIRYMFYDLYKNGTIFEVVFDMPKFLVKYANKGFYSQDLESELNIKGTTAKKYIKIMINIGLIRQDKTTGRKHYYRLIRENVMKRLGSDQNTLIRQE